MTQSSFAALHAPFDTASLPTLSVTMLLIASVVIVTLLGWSSPRAQQAMILRPYDVGRGQIYRLLTGAWVHADVSHLAFNMLTLYFFADQTIQVLGPTIFLALYFSAAVVAFIPTTLRHLRDPSYRSLGASGAVAAVMMSAILLHPKLRLYVMLIPVPIPGGVFAIGYIAYSLWRSSRSRSDGVNHFAHLSGIFYGALFTYALEPARVATTIQTWRSMLLGGH